MSVRNAVRRSLRLLTLRDRRLLVVSTLIQMGTSLLDLVGVLLIGLVGALSVTTVQSQPPPNLIVQITSLFGLESASSQELVMILAGAAAVVLLAKSIVSTLLNRRVLIFLANRQALVSARLMAALMDRPITFLTSRSSQETAFALIGGAGAATMTILGQAVVVLTELALLTVLGLAVLLISPVVAIGAITFFALIAWVLQRTMGGWASRVGREYAAAEIQSLEQVQEAMSTYREVTITDRRGLYVRRFQSLRWSAAKLAADGQFIGMLPKYMFEVALVIGGFALAAILFSTQDSVSAVGTLALFLAAGTRVMPSLLRLQGSALALRNAAGTAQATFTLADDLLNPTQDPDTDSDLERVRMSLAAPRSGLDPTIEVEGVSYRYPDSHEPTIWDVSFSAPAGTSVALVGSSGAGKSTLADIVLGVLTPMSGSVSIGGISPEEAVRKWPGAIGYVPQEVALANASIRANVALGIPETWIDDEAVWSALERAHLSEFVRSTPDGINTLVGERGARLSGGQRQRLGIARALYSRPSLLVLDEATSALDATTENLVATTIQELEGSVTTLVIAHRLSTIRHVDLLIYLDRGRILAKGRFDEVRSSLPKLDAQATLMGLT